MEPNAVTGESREAHWFYVASAYLYVYGFPILAPIGAYQLYKWIANALGF